jgi:hypothetical protein
MAEPHDNAPHGKRDQGGDQYGEPNSQGRAAFPDCLNGIMGVRHELIRGCVAHGSAANECLKSLYLRGENGDAVSWPGQPQSRVEQARPDGRLVTGELQGWQFRIDVIPAGLRISASAPGGGDPAVWVVTG